MSDQSNGLSFLDSKVDITQYPRLTIAKPHVTKLYVGVERLYRYIALGSNGIDGIKNVVDPLQRGNSLLNAVRCFRQIFERRHKAVKHYQIVDKRRCIERTRFVENQHTAIEQQYADNNSPQKLAQRVCQQMTAIDSAEGGAYLVVDFGKPAYELIFGIESLHNTYPSERLLYLR